MERNGQFNFNFFPYFSVALNTEFHVIHIQKFKPSTIQILLWI